jgi:hypothetical protein
MLLKEILTEISKKTLGSYITKAADDVADYASRAAYKLAGGDEEAARKGDDGEKDDHKAYLRKEGIKKAAKKLAK